MNADEYTRAYAHALRGYAERPSEETLQIAYELGRRASNEDELDLLQLVGLHNRLSREVITASSEALLAADRCAEFLMEVLPHFEMKLRGYREANDRLQQRNVELAAARQEALDASRAKSTFLSNMSHELRTPLNSIIGFTDVILSGLSGPLTDEQAYQLSLVASAGAHLLSLVNDLLDLGRIEAGRIDIFPEAVDLDPLIGEVLDTVHHLAERKGLRIRGAPRCGVRLRTDRRLLGQVMLNLLTNAVKFTDRGEIGVRCMTDDGSVAIEVSDTGVGIAPGQLSRLFHPFERVHEGADAKEGTGLGLYLSREFVERLGGRIEVRSEAGRGSHFTVRLPLALPEAHAVAG